MRWIMVPTLSALALLSTLASNTASAQQWGTRAACAPAPVGVTYSRVEYTQAAPAPVYVQSARTIQLYAPPPVPRTVYYYAAPAPAYYAAPAYLTVPPKRFPTPLRSFLFGN